jgi:hypothetical protein
MFLDSRRADKSFWTEWAWDTLYKSPYFSNHHLFSYFETTYFHWLNYRVFRAQADWTLTHTSHKDTEQSAIEASITLDSVTLTDSLIR